MTLETFFEKFDLFADAPDAVAKMRELVLEMALQGKLSEQRREDAKDPEWLELIQRLDVDAESMAAATDPPVEIPDAWRWTTLESLGDTKPRNDAPDSAEASFVPMTFIPADFGQSAKHKVRPWGEIKKGYTHFQDGDVVMAKITPCFENGKSTVMNRLTGGIGAGTTELHVFRSNGSAILPEFVIIQLKSCGFIMRGISRMTGSAGQKRVPYDYFARAPFPLPPLAEQKRIVAKVDELMALCDRLEALEKERESRHRGIARASLARFADAPTPANLNLLFHSSFSIRPSDLRKSILTLAVQGKLVPQDPNDEPAEELLARVREDSRANKKGSTADPFEVAEDELPHEVPFGWRWSCVQELAQPNESVTYGILKPVWVESGVPTVRVTEMKTGVIDVGALPKCDPQRAAKFSKTTLNEGDLLVSKDGTIGKTAFVPRELTGGNITQHMLRFAISKRLDRDFVRLCIDAPPCQAWMVGETKGVALQGVNVGDFRRMPLPVPPLAEQRRIVAKVSELMALVDALETQLAASRATAANLLSALVAELTTA